MKFILLFVCVLCSWGSASAQIEKLFINIRGEFEMVIRVADNGTVTITDRGEIIDIDMGSEFSYYDKWNINTDNINSGKVSKVGNIQFKYYDKWNINTDSDNQGKIARIGNLDFAYYDKWNINTDNYNRGKIARIGKTQFGYYDKWDISTDEHNGGKIKKIGCASVKYYDKRHMRTSRYNQGLIAEIEKNTYTYNDTSHSNRHGTLIKSGERSFVSCNGFRVILTEPRRHR